MQTEIKTAQPWLQILQAACDVSSITAVAKRLGYSRTTISQCLSETYNGNTKHVEKKVMAELAKHTCPALGYEITPSDCAEYCRATAPVQNPSRMRHWRVCQSCEHNQATGVK